MKTCIAFLFFCIGTSSLFCQDSTSILVRYKDSTNYKLVIRTEVLVEDDYVAMDNFTARITDDTVKIYYMRYGDGMVSSLMIPFPVYKELLDFEQKTIAASNGEAKSEYSIKFEIGEAELRVPVDILLIDNLTHFVFSLEE